MMNLSVYTARLVLLSHHDAFRILILIVLHWHRCEDGLSISEVYTL